MFKWVHFFSIALEAVWLSHHRPTFRFPARARSAGRAWSTCVRHAIQQTQGRQPLASEQDVRKRCVFRKQHKCLPNPFQTPSRFRGSWQRTGCRGAVHQQSDTLMDKSSKRVTLSSAHQIKAVTLNMKCKYFQETHHFKFCT